MKMLLGCFLLLSEFEALAANPPIILDPAQDPPETTKTTTPVLSSKSPNPAKSPPSAQNQIISDTNSIFQEVGPEVFRLGKVTLDKKHRSISFPSIVNMREGPVEYFLVTDFGKRHESVLRTDTAPYHIHMAMLFLDANAAQSKPIMDRPQGSALPAASREIDQIYPRAAAPQDKIPGDRVDLELKWMIGGKEVRKRTADLVSSAEAKTTPAQVEWFYTGSRMINRVFLAQELGNLASLVTDSDALLNNEGPGHEDDHIWSARPENLPPIGTSVEVTIRFLDKAGNQ